MIEAIHLLDDSDEALRQLRDGCCKPGRSPQMEELAEGLDAIRYGLQSVEEDPVQAENVLKLIEDVGANIGRLQVGCCAPNRIPLYARMLEDLTKVQRLINRSLGVSH